MEDLHDFILVKPIISEAPVYEERRVVVPELEKVLVDHSADKEFASLSDEEIQREYQRAFELYHVNTSRLLRYAGRKGKKEEVQVRVRQIDQERVRIVHTIQDFFQQEPVERAWIFGSFSRMEERPDSDIDILIDLASSAKVGLLYYAGIINHLQERLGRKVDLVANGSIKPFALDSINRDKVLVYERA
ncbi:MAG: nucleotidyltransferase domain-containing protein [Bacteroidales bacterium]|nr:nucleotidyltransferase domain-containing protein [Bacteroidales bacterium]